MNWQELSVNSHYQTSEKRALKNQLIRLMMHIIKWKSQCERRSRSWVASIYNARREIRDIQKETPSLNKNVISDMWDECLSAAIPDAEGEMNKASEISELSWKEVFEEEYRIEKGI